MTLKKLHQGHNSAALVPACATSASWPPAWLQRGGAAPHDTAAALAIQPERTANTRPPAASGHYDPASLVELRIPNAACQFRPWSANDGKVFEFFAFACVPALDNSKRPVFTPKLTCAAACDNQHGVFLSADIISQFLSIHRDVPYACHDAALTLRMLAPTAPPALDVYEAVEGHRVWDTLVLNRLLSLATEGHAARDDVSLASCVRARLGKDFAAATGRPENQRMRNRCAPVGTTPAGEAARLAHASMVTLALYRNVVGQIHETLGKLPSSVLGFAGWDWFNQAYDQFGPLTHHTQVKASILADVLSSRGVTIDRQRFSRKSAELDQTIQGCLERLGQYGYRPGEAGTDQLLHDLFQRVCHQHPEFAHLADLPEGACITQDHLRRLKAVAPMFSEIIAYRQAERLRSTYMSKLGQYHARSTYGFLAATGRMYCGGGLNLQSLPREDRLLELDPKAATIRGLLVPAPGHVFIDADYKQIELVALAYSWRHQLFLGSALHDLVNSGSDVHRKLAALFLEKQETAITADERGRVKPVSFGVPGGMGIDGLRAVAWKNYCLDLSANELERMLDAYKQICPELIQHGLDIDINQVVADSLQLKCSQYTGATGVVLHQCPFEASSYCPWLGEHFLEALRTGFTPSPQRPYTPSQLAFFQTKNKQLSQLLPPGERYKLEADPVFPSAYEAVRDWAGRRPVFTATGRLRANASFCASRNTLFQGLAADGAILGMWRLWRAGYRVVLFVHDQVVVEAPADELVLDKVNDVKRHLIAGMQSVMPGMLVSVDARITTSLNPRDRDPRFPPLV